MLSLQARAAIETVNKIVNLDSNLELPQLCATIACDINKHLIAYEVRIIYTAIYYSI